MNDFLKEFKKRVYKKKIKIAVVGLGYVGLPLAVAFAKKGFSVLGLDVDSDRIRQIKRGKSYITDVKDLELRQVQAADRFKADNDFRALKEFEVIFICVPTPLKRKYHPDISYIKQAVKSISKHLEKPSLVILESTTYPGTTEEVILPLFKQNKLKHNRDFYLCFSPERIDPGNKSFPLNRIPKIVGGVSKEATDLAVSIYKNIIDKVIPVSSARTAEAVKLLENTFRLVNIGLIDELAMMAHRMNIDIWEVISAAQTKPFGFMPFYPGPGVGGHCLDKNETLCVRDKNSLKIMQMPDFIRYIRDTKNNEIEVLSFDPIKKRSVFKNVTAASARLYFGKMLNILTEDGRHLKVTDFHPMFVCSNGSWNLKYAKDLQKGDCLPVSLKLPRFTPYNSKNEIDLIEGLPQKNRDLIEKVRVKPLGFSWKDYASQIKYILRQENKNKLPDILWDYLSDNVLPLRYFYVLERLVKIDHRRVKLVTGRGPSYSEIPAKINLDEDFCRLIGYYLSEGCYTKDKSARIRFSFNRSEKEYIQDVVNILHRLGIRTSIYESKKWNTSCVKVSSNLFGFLIYDVLGCGKNCYDMAIPEHFFSLDKEKKKAVLSGIFRGDACVEHFFGKRHYSRNGKEYFHNVNTANISFFTSSKKLFQQLIIFLHDLNIVPTFKMRKYTLSIFGYRQLAFCKDLFDGKKKQVIERYLDLNKNRPKNKTFKKIEGFAIVKIKSITSTKGGWVYSIEAAKPHTFVTSYGIAVHNCIPKDPLYLYWKARHHGFKSRFIKLASEIISRMPAYVVERVMNLLLKKKASSKIKVLLIGVTYKKDVRDLRKSPALDIIDILQRKNIKVSYYDPLIPYLKLNHINLKSINLKKQVLNKYDCVVITADHSTLDYDFIFKNSKLILDTRNVYKNIKDKKLFRL